MEKKLANEKNFKVAARGSNELMQMQKKLMLFLTENEYNFVDEEGFIKVQISPLKLAEVQKG